MLQSWPRTSSSSLPTHEARRAASALLLLLCVGSRERPALDNCGCCNGRGYRGASGRSGGMAATLDIANAVEGEAVAVERTEAITQQLLDSALQREASKFQGALDALWLWFRVGFYGFLAFYALRHWRDLLRFVNFIKRAFTNVTTSQKP